MADVWVRPELKNTLELVTPSAFGEARGLDTTAMASRLKRYADKAPGVVLVVNNRTRYYLEAELEKFLEETSSLPPRSAREVAYAEVVYLEQAIKEGEAGLELHDKSVATSEEHLRKITEAVDKKKDTRRKAVAALNRRRKDLEITRAKLALAD